MRYAKAHPRDFRFSLDYMELVAPEHLSPSKRSMVLATRETRHVRFTLGVLSLGVVFASRWLCRSRSSTALSLTTTTLLVVDEAKIVVAQHRNCSLRLVVDSHNNHVPTARGDT